MKKKIDEEVEEKIAEIKKESIPTERPEITEQHRLMVEKAKADQLIAQSRK